MFTVQMVDYNWYNEEEYQLFMWRKYKKGKQDRFVFPSLTFIGVDQILVSVYSKSRRHYWPDAATPYTPLRIGPTTDPDTVVNCNCTIYQNPVLLRKYNFLYPSLGSVQAYCLQNWGKIWTTFEVIKSLNFINIKFSFQVESSSNGIEISMFYH